jgi:hypothetical protein
MNRKDVKVLLATCAWVVPLVMLSVVWGMEWWQTLTFLIGAGAGGGVSLMLGEEKDE